MSGAIIFIHGLGDSGAGWSHLRDQLPIPDVTWMFPDAPEVGEQRTTENKEERTGNRDVAHSSLRDRGVLVLHVLFVF